MMPAYYNEIDPKAAAWLRQLIKEGLIAYGQVDERSIADVQPSDLAGFCQCHFFAGIGGWSLALRIAGWPDDRPVWTGSCPCQPFSCAGKGEGEKDERHLWPEFRRLISECNPAVAFGEQVASNAGRAWLTGVRSDLEALGYAVGAADLCAAGVNAPHIRQRLWWVADSEVSGHARREYIRTSSKETGQRARLLRASGYCASRRLAAADNQGSQGRDGSELRECTRQRSPWAGSTWHQCSDGKQRRIPAEPAFFPLAHGLPARVVRLRGYGNAIVPQVAATFIGAYLDGAD